MTFLTDLTERYSVPDVSKAIANYRVLYPLGKGAHASVFAALNPQDERVAIKVVTIAPNSGPTNLDRLEREAEIIKSLRHPNIAQLNRSIKEGDQYIFEFEYVEGQTMRTFIDSRRDALLLEPHLWILSEIAHGLSAAHARGIIHRDIKPENILVGEKGEIRIADFGLATVEWKPSHLTIEQNTMGTLSYMSPEALNGKAVTTASDIFSFGVLAFELLTGEFPFPHTDAQTLIRSVMNDEPHFAVTKNAKIPLVISRLVNQCLSRDPSLRPSIWSVQDTLMNYLKQTRTLEFCCALISKDTPPEKIKLAFKNKFTSLSEALEQKMNARQFESTETLALLNEFSSLYPQGADVPRFLSAFQTRSHSQNIRPNRTHFLASLSAVAITLLSLSTGTKSETLPASARGNPEKQSLEAASPAFLVKPPTQSQVRAARQEVDAAPHHVSRSAAARVDGMLTASISEDIRVFIDGRRFTSAQLMKLPLSPGKHMVVLEKEGFLPASRELNIRPGRTSYIHVGKQNSDD